MTACHRDTRRHKRSPEVATSDGSEMAVRDRSAITVPDTITSDADEEP